MMLRRIGGRAMRWRRVASRMINSEEQFLGSLFVGGEEP
jgi:hypothetical protein